MRIEDRHRQIVEQVRGARRILVAKLVGHFGITPETIRRDLTTLNHSGVLRKTHGGTIPAPALLGADVTQREQVNSTAKQAATRAALARPAPKSGTTLLINAGTTTGSLARLLPGDGDLTVTTNSVLTAAWLTGAGRTRVRILGSQLRGFTRAAAGLKTVKTLSTLRVDVTALGANGLSTAHGLSTSSPDEATVKRAMVHSIRQVAALISSTEIGQEHLVSFAFLDDIDLLATDVELPPALIDQLTATETEVFVA